LAAFIALVVCATFLAGMGSSPGDGGRGPRAEVEAALDAGIPVLIDAGSTHCVPCKQMLPVLEYVKKKYKGRLKVVMVDVEEHQNYAKRLGVMVIPTQILSDRAGKEVARHVGFMSEEEADKFVSKVLK
jgi:thioredoxin